MAVMGSPVSYAKLVRIYVRCAGLNLETLRRHRCPGVSAETPPPVPAKLPKPLPAKEAAAMPKDEEHSSERKSEDSFVTTVSRSFIRLCKMIFEAFIDGLKPTLMNIAYFIGLVAAAWLWIGCMWLGRKVTPPHVPTSMGIELTEFQAGDKVNDVGDPLPIAALEGLTEDLKRLVEAGTNLNTRDMCGRIPIELAAVFGTREDVQILFPFTSPIPTVANWSVDGIINQMKLQRQQLQDDEIVEARKSELKNKGDYAFSKEDYMNASAFYTQAIMVDPYDAVLLSSQSLCWLRAGDGRKALQDALKWKTLQPQCAKAYLRQGQALILLQEYREAMMVLSEGLELDRQDAEICDAFCEALKGCIEAA